MSTFKEDERKVADMNAVLQASLEIERNYARDDLYDSTPIDNHTINVSTIPAGLLGQPVLSIPIRLFSGDED